jgi:ATP-dependent Clp endopeptidase proteolytic subunit ClpP
MARTELDDIMEYGANLAQRRIYIGVDGFEANDFTDITVQSVDRIIRIMHRMIDEDHTKTIELHVNSPGGDPYAALRLYDEIQSCPCPIRFIGGGVIASAATIVMVGCDERYIHNHTTIMLHDGYEGSDGKHTDVQIEAKEFKRLQDAYDELYAKNSRMPVEFWQDTLQRDLYLDADEAIALGLADKKILAVKRGSLRKVRTGCLNRKVEPAEMKKLLSTIYRRLNKVRVPKLQLNEFEEEVETVEEPSKVETP